MKYLNIAVFAILALAGLTATARAQTGLENNPHRGLIVGGSVYFLQPYLNNSPAYSRNTLQANGNQVLTTPEFSWPTGVSPAIYIGSIIEPGFGIRGRFFSFDKNSNTLNDSSSIATDSIVPPIGISLPAISIPGLGTQSFGSPGVFLFNSGGAALGTDVLSFRSSLSIQTFDAEILYADCWGWLDLEFGAGGRYIRLAQRYNATLTNQPEAGAAEMQTLLSDQSFYGGGPTMSFTARAALGQTNFALYAGARGSLLIGSNIQQSSYNLSLTDPNNLLANGNGATTLNLTNSLRSVSNQVLPVLEFEIGADYYLGSSGLFVRGALVNQTYFNISNLNNSGTLGLFGGQFSVGFNF